MCPRTRFFHDLYAVLPSIVVQRRESELAQNYGEVISQVFSLNDYLLNWNRQLAKI